MKTLILTSVAAATLFGAAMPAAASAPIEGRWARGNMQIQIAPCNHQCSTGVIVQP